MQTVWGLGIGSLVGAGCGSNLTQLEQMIRPGGAIDPSGGTGARDGGAYGAWVRHGG